MASDRLQALDTRHLQLLDGWQRDFPRVSRPFRTLARAVGMDEPAVVRTFRTWLEQGLISRIGPVINQACFGASALVAMQVPQARLGAVAACVSAFPEVNHNYEREHTINLWFVVASRSESALRDVLGHIQAETQCLPIPLRMKRAYHIDLGFSLQETAARPRPGASFAPSALAILQPREEVLLRAVQRGLDIVAAPYQMLGARLGMEEAELLAILDSWLETGVLKRFGVVLRHRALGYTANAMCVWDVDDALVDALGERLACEPGVTLCYRRERHRPAWRYNLFCMIHGKARDAVLRQRAGIAARIGLDTWPHAVLFSQRQFKQRGAWLGPCGNSHDLSHA